MRKKKINNIVSFLLDKPIILLLVLAAALRLYFLFDWHNVWWDSGSYIGMGKWIWSAGASGLWEDIRPVLWPIILGFFWKMKLNPIGFGRALIFALSLSNVYLVYSIGEKVFNKRVAIIAAALFAFSPIFFFLGFHIYTGIPSLFFALIGFLLFFNQKYYFAGLFIGLSFLTRFPMGLLGISLGVVLLYGKKWKNAVILLTGFLSLLFPFLIFNAFLYGAPFLPLIKGQDIIGKVVGCNYLRANPWYAYFSWLWIEHYFYILAIPGIYFIWKRITKNKIVILLAAIIPLIYLMSLSCRDYRYILGFLPFVAFVAAVGIDECILFVKKKWRFKVFLIVLLVVLLTAIPASISFYNGNEEKIDSAAEGYFSFLHRESAEKEVWVAHPVLAAYSDLPLNMIYYPVYNKELSTDFYEYLISKNQNISYVAIDNCGGGLICKKEDKACKDQTKLIEDYLDENLLLVYNESTGRCWYRIYSEIKVSTYPQ